MKVFVTGATGFVGKDLMMRLRAAQVEVITAGRDVNSDIAIQAIDGLTDWSAAYFHEVSSVVHLAGHVHKMSEPDTLRYFAVNRDGSVNLARAAAKAGVKQFIFMSSVKAMGECTEFDRPFSRNSPCLPTDPYGRSKLEAEQALLKIGEETGMHIICLRPPLVYGPSVRANFRSLMKLIQLRIPLPFAGINNKRSMVFVGNLTNLIMHCLYNRQANGIFLVSDGPAMSTADLVAEISQAFGSQPRLFYVPNMIWTICRKLPIIGEMSRRLTESLEVDMQETIQELDWSPPYSASKGIYDTVEYFQQK